MVCAEQGGRFSVGAVSVGEKSWGGQKLHPMFSAHTNNTHIETRGGFAIPLGLSQERLCTPMGLKHWGLWFACAYVNNTHPLRT